MYCRTGVFSGTIESSASNVPCRRVWIDTCSKLSSKAPPAVHCCIRSRAQRADEDAKATQKQGSGSGSTRPEGVSAEPTYITTDGQIFGAPVVYAYSETKAPDGASVQQPMCVKLTRVIACISPPPSLSLPPRPPSLPPSLPLWMHHIVTPAKCALPAHHIPPIMCYCGQQRAHTHNRVSLSDHSTLWHTSFTWGACSHTDTAAVPTCTPLWHTSFTWGTCSHTDTTAVLTCTRRYATIDDAKGDEYCEYFLASTSPIMKPLPLFKMEPTIAV